MEIIGPSHNLVQGLWEQTADPEEGKMTIREIKAALKERGITLAEFEETAGERIFPMTREAFEEIVRILVADREFARKVKILSDLKKREAVIPCTCAACEYSKKLIQELRALDGI